MSDPDAPGTHPSGCLRLFLAGDVMIGRGIDQAMAHRVDPRLYEPYVRDANDYVALAERANGPIHRPIDDHYIWGEALDVLNERQPAARIINLETAITADGQPWPGKGIHYRMHPANMGSLRAAGIDCCALANNHLLDWGRAGLADTLAALDSAGIAHCGAGATIEEACRPAVVPVSGGRLLVFACGHGSSGIPGDWAAGRQAGGVWRLDDLSELTARQVGEAIEMHRQPGDIVMVSIHIGDNWGYRVDQEQQRFTRLLVDIAGADLVHGHSSHHPRPLEIHNRRLILHGCGDLINDYEGIAGHEGFRPDLVAMYFPELSSDGSLAELNIVPMRLKNFHLQRATPDEARWLADTLNRTGPRQACRLQVSEGGILSVA
jgi:poly-gamma-glutamate capsule biosynthesis protein CapA/YwtB (metallophosphatase superfamily)